MIHVFLQRFGPAVVVVFVFVVVDEESKRKKLVQFISSDTLHYFSVIIS